MLKIKTNNFDLDSTMLCGQAFRYYVLDDNSYVKTNLVTTTGEYAVRSFIIDLYPLNYENPIRIEFFGSDIESIRFFDSETQISNKSIDCFELYSFNDKVSENKENIINKLNNPFVFFVDYKKIQKSFNDFQGSKNEFEITIDNNIFNNASEKEKAELLKVRNISVFKLNACI